MLEEREVDHMVYVEMGGRCGNQLFHYALGRYVQLKNNDDELILNFNQVYSKNKEAEGWYDVLKEYKTVPYKYYTKQGTVLKNESNFFQKLLIAIKTIHIKLYSNSTRQKRANIASVGLKILNYFGIYWVREGVNKLYFKKINRKSIVSGPCEATMIYEIQNLLQSELEPREAVMPKNQKLFNEISNVESVCVSVRRGDFFNSANIKSFAVCTEKYYKNAKVLMDNKLANKKNVRYYIFSDDIKWCKETLKFSENNITFVSQDMPVYETLRLMYSCKHFILSNSTFSWWGQFLSKNMNKIIISPIRWNNDDYDSVLINRKEWILIDEL